jgi:glycerophosphoryl diester phosphodiesterase
MSANSSVQVIAHRGASKAARENTIEAFRLARTLGAGWVELDVRRTQDDRLAIHHDPYLPDGRVLCDTASDDLPADVPDLVAALDACEGMGVNIEIKNLPGELDFDPDERVAEQVVALVRQRNEADRILVSSFHLATIDAIRAAEPTIATAWLVEKATFKTLDTLQAHGHRVLHPWVRKLDRPLIEECQRRGVAVNTWTCDDPDRMRELVSWGIDGICTNVPDVAVRVLSHIPNA